MSVYARYGGPGCVAQVELNATIAQNEYLAATGKPQRSNYSGQRLCSRTIVNPPIPCRPGAPAYCVPIPAKPRPPHVLTPKTKLELKQAAIAAGLRSLGTRAALGLNALLPPFLRFLSAEQREFLRGYARGAQLASSAYRFLATVVDPADPNFGSIARPRPVRVAWSASRARLPRPFVHDLRALGRDDAEIEALAHALATALNRASGALAAGDIAARGAQLRAAARYAREEARELRADITLRAALERLLPASDPLDARQLAALHARGKHSSSPIPVGSLLRDATANKAERAAASGLDRLARTLSR